MSKTVDERVVEMKFDNQQFESNVQTSISTLDKLKSSLNLTGATKGLEDIDTTAKKMNFNGLTSAVDTVKERFSALEVMAVAALANITNSIVNTGKQMLESLTTAPIKDGFSEYELKMGSVQTIMMSTGESLETVNTYLDELNTYADKTIYSFSDMTSNIGKFTNAGVNLKDAVKAIQGVSNVAAISGANTAEASRAMYNFAQALSAGSVKLIDWKSIENANMATVDFKNHLLETAVELGTVVKQGDKYVSTTTNINGKTSDAFDATTNFNDSLNHQWMTTDVLVKTLNEYSDETTEIGKKAFAAAQDVKTFTQLLDTLKEAVGSGWATTWEIIFGDFDEAKKLWTGVSNAVSSFIDTQSTARNELLQQWKDLGGRTALITAFKMAFTGLSRVLKTVKEAFQEVFPPLTGKQLADFSKTMRGLSKRLIFTSETLGNIKNTFKGFFSVLSILKNLIVTVAKISFPFFSKAAGVALKITGYLGSQISTFDAFLKRIVFFNNIVESVTSGLQNVRTAVISFYNSLKKKYSTPTLENTESSLDRIKNKLSIVGGFFIEVKNKITSALSEIWKTVSGTRIFKIIRILSGAVIGTVKGIISAIDTLTASVTEKFAEVNFDNIFDAIRGLSTGGVAVSLILLVKKLRKVFSNLADTFEGFNGILNNVTGILDGVRDCLKAYQNDLKAKTLIKIALAIGILAASLFVISCIDTGRMLAAVGAISTLLAELVGAIAILSKINIGVVKTAKLTIAMTALSASILTMAVACRALSTIDASGLKNALVAIAVLMVEMSVYSKIMSNNTKNLFKASAAMVILGAALRVMASACSALAKIDDEGITRALIAIGVLLLEVTAYAKFTTNVKGIFTISGALCVLGDGIKTMASACEALSKISIIDLIKGLASIAVILLEVSMYAKMTSGVKGIIKASAAMIVLGAGLKVMASACKQFSAIDIVGLIKGLASIAVILLEVSMYAKMTSGVKGIIKASAAMIVLGAGLKVMASACKQLAAIDTIGLIKALSTIGVLLLEVAAFEKIAGKAKGILKASAAVVALGVGLSLITPVIQELGSIDIPDIVKALLAMAGVFTVIGVASKLLSPVVPAMIKLGAALVLLGAGITVAGIGLQFFSSGLISFGTAAVDTTEKTRKILLASLIFISESAPAFGQAIKDILFTLIDVIKDSVPPIVETVFELIISVLDELVKNAPKIIDDILVFLIELLEGIASRMPELVKAAINVLVSFFTSLGDALNSVDMSGLMNGILAVGMVAALMTLLGSVVGMIPQAIIGVLGIGVILAEISLVLAAIGALQQIPGLNWLINEGGKLLEAIGTAIGSFIGGIVWGIVKGFSDQLPAIGANLSQFMENLQPFITGAANLDASSLEGVRALAQIILLLTAAELLDGIASWLTGGSSLATFGEELASFGASMMAYADSVKGIDQDAVKNSAVAAGALAELEHHLKNHGGVFQFFGGDSNLADFGKNLIVLGVAMKVYSDSIKGLDPDAVENSAIAAGALAELENKLKNHGGFAQFFSGDSDLEDLGNCLKIFGPAMKTYGDSVKGIDPNAVESSAIAAGALAELENKLKNHGGFAQFFSGDSDLEDLGNCLKIFGPAMKTYGDSVKGIDPNAVESSAIAAGALAELENKLKNHGGFVQFFSGDSDLESFGKSLVIFGLAMGGYGQCVKDIEPNAVESSAVAAGALAELETKLRNHGGVFSIFAGDADLGSFGKSLGIFGIAIAGYSRSVSGISPEAVEASAIAAGSLAELESKLKNHGGIFQLFTGDSNLEDLGNGLDVLGPAMKKYGDSVAGVKPEAVEASANAAGSLAELESKLKNHGGIFQLFTGDSDLEDLANGIKILGPAMKEYGNSVEGIDPNAIESSAIAAGALAELENKLKNHGGIFQFFTGDSNLEDLSNGIKILGPAMKEYGDSVKGIDPNAVESSAIAAGALAELESKLKNHGGFTQFFTGDSDLEDLANGIKILGPAMKEYADSVEGVDPDAIQSSANAAGALAEVSKMLPTIGGIGSWFVGNAQTLDEFGNQIPKLGEGLSKFDKSVKNIDSAKLSKTIDAVTKLAELGVKLKNVDVTLYGTFSEGLTKMANDGINGFTSAFQNAKSDIQQSAYNMLKTFTFAFEEKQENLINQIKAMMKSAISELKKCFVDFYDAGENAAKQLVKGIKDKQNSAANQFVEILAAMFNKAKEYYSNFLNTGKESINYFVSGINNKKNEPKNTVVIIISAMISGIRGKYYEFQNAGSFLVEGFIAGIDYNTVKAKKAAQNMANATSDAAKKALDERSPSKVGYKIGDYFGIAFVNAINDYQSKSYDAGKNVAASARSGLTTAMTQLDRIINSDMDIQPSIRPVIDLSSVNDGVKKVNALLSANQSYRLASASGFGVNTSFTSNHEITINNSEIIKEMNRLRNDIVSLNDAVGKMQIVMDTGALVGSITIPMNNALNKQVAYKRRGN